MNENQIDNYMISDNKKKQLLEEAIVVFDSSSLLNFYYYSSSTQTSILRNIREKLEDRLWIPGHVEYEYLMNREKVIKQPIDDKYGSLKKERVQEIEKLTEKLSMQLNSYLEQSGKDDKHPHIDNTIGGDFKEAFSIFDKAVEEFSEKVESEIKKREKEIKSFIERDLVLDIFSDIFDVGEEYEFDEMMSIVEEGKLRYAEQIPPGYKDVDKKGLQIYGDLIIWKQILEFAQNKGKPILFVLDDVKEDWCVSKSRGDKRIVAPNNDLIKEFSDRTGSFFWMFTLSQFLYLGEEYLGFQIEEETLDEVKETKTTNAGLKFNGVYMTEPMTGGNIKESYRSYLKFSEDGTVKYISMVNSTPNSALNVMEKESFYAGGTFSISGEEIEFTTKSVSGEIDYKGIIEEGMLNLDSYSHINGNYGSRIFYFVPLD